MTGNDRPHNGFTMVEMTVVISIAMLMLVLTIISFPKLKNQISMSLAARGMGLALRQAQSSAIAVREFDSSFSNLLCQTGVAPPVRFPPYGVSITSIDPADSRDSSTYILFGDIACASLAPTPPIYNPSYGTSEIVSTTRMQNGVRITSITGYGATTDALDIADIIYQRPSPNVILIGQKSSDGAWVVNYNRIDITLTSPDGISKIITVRTSGQISL